MISVSIGSGVVLIGAIALIGSCACSKKSGVDKQRLKLNTLNTEMAASLTHYFVVVDFSKVEKRGSLEEEVVKYHYLMGLFRERCSHIQGLREQGSSRVRGKATLDAFNQLMPAYSKRFAEIRLTQVHQL